MDFSGAKEVDDFDSLPPIPDGTLAWATLKYKGFKQSKTNRENWYIKFANVIAHGPYKGRWVWSHIGIEGSEDYVNIGQSNIKAILETGFNAHINPEAYHLPLHPGFDDLPRNIQWHKLNDLIVAVQIKARVHDNAVDGYEKYQTPLINPGATTDAQANKKIINEIKQYLSSNPDSKRYKLYEQLLIQSKNVYDTAGKQSNPAINPDLNDDVSF